jgi:hypothetical protein
VVLDVSSAENGVGFVVVHDPFQFNGSVVDLSVSAASVHGSSSSGSSSSSRAPKPLRPPPLQSPAFVSVASNSVIGPPNAAIDALYEPLISARALRESIDSMIHSAAAVGAPVIASHEDTLSNVDEDTMDPSTLASALFAGQENMPQRPSAVKGVQKRSPRFDLVRQCYSFECYAISMYGLTSQVQVAGKSHHSKSNPPPPPSLAYSSPLVAPAPVPEASRIPKLRSRFPVVSKPPDADVPIQRPQWLIDEVGVVVATHPLSVAFYSCATGTSTAGGRSCGC